MGLEMGWDVMLLPLGWWWSCCEEEWGEKVTHWASPPLLKVLLSRLLVGFAPHKAFVLESDELGLALWSSWRGMGSLAHTVFGATPVVSIPGALVQ